MQKRKESIESSNIDANLIILIKFFIYFTCLLLRLSIRKWFHLRPVIKVGRLINLMMEVPEVKTIKELNNLYLRVFSSLELVLSAQLKRYRRFLETHKQTLRRIEDTLGTNITQTWDFDLNPAELKVLRIIIMLFCLIDYIISYSF